MYDPLLKMTHSLTLLTNFKRFWTRQTLSTLSLSRSSSLSLSNCVIVIFNYLKAQTGVKFLLTGIPWNASQANKDEKRERGTNKQRLEVSEIVTQMKRVLVLEIYRYCHIRFLIITTLDNNNNTLRTYSVN